MTEESKLESKDSSCEVLGTFKTDDFVLEEIYTNPTTNANKSIEEAFTSMYEVFGKMKNPKPKTPEAKILKQDDEIDLRLAQLGIDNKFCLCKDKDGKLSYKSHIFNINCKTE